MVLGWGANKSPNAIPIGSMYGIFPYIYHKFKPNVGKYTSPMDPMGYKSLGKSLELSLIPLASSFQLGRTFFQYNTRKKIRPLVPEGPKFCLEVFFFGLGVN